ncbi:TolB family protein [Lentiprolixibacter aurantiacus]|uniref:Cell envelope biogenesis protein OmpA n=1 Tax=Lentiprolixibacter aurantiacus TaxID=2993939 RepID=A0AAE3MLV6_9FLAO|nr:cell envelope biogenesis protein OmpA [Lentiprolixibacter aurantiacus]MCX2719751.1 cell envelope biogenesis protein OmpA [Lentiprolixibacter aurantiacus]
MNRIITYSRVLASLLLLMCFTVSAQRTNASTEYIKKKEAEKRIKDYQKLIRLGYTDQEIFEDLGNVNFLSENYETAAFWYQKLIDLSGVDNVSQSYHERYLYARQQAGLEKSGPEVAQRDWYSRIKEDYQIDQGPVQDEFTRRLAENYQMPEFGRSNQVRNVVDIPDHETYASVASRKGAKSYAPPVAVSADGRTAYFTKVVHVKPLYGVFSKKQPLTKIFRAEREGDQWTNVEEVAVCPKYASAMHPAISPDGKRLFFASDMPGTFGKYDIYVSDIKRDGSLGTAKNLGSKVNTRKNDLYPSVVADNLLFFASDGRDGYGGLDLYAVQVVSNQVGLAMNIGAPFNSRDDDFALKIQADQGLAYVVSNRGKQATELQELVFSYKGDRQNTLAENRNQFLELLPADINTGLSNTVFEYED